MACLDCQHLTKESMARAGITDVPLPVVPLCISKLSSTEGAKGAELRATVPTTDSTLPKSAIFSPDTSSLGLPLCTSPKAPDVHVVMLMSCWKAAGAPALETSAQFPAKSASLPSVCRRKPCALSCTGWAGMTSKTEVFIHKAETMQGRLHVQ